MSRRIRGSQEHEDTLFEFVKELRENGYHVILLQDKSPDAIAVKDDKIYAVESLGFTYVKGIGKRRNWTWSQKKATYSMFDGLLVKQFMYKRR